MKNKEPIRKLSPFINSKWWVIGLILLIAVVSISISSGGRILPISDIFLLAKPTVTPTPSPTVSDIVPPFKANLPKQTYVEMAIGDLIDKLKVDRSKIEVSEVVEHKWNDTSLGCPQKGKMYTQIITAGFVIKLKWQNKLFIYNAGLNKVINCQNS